MIDEPTMCNASAQLSSHLDRSRAPRARAWVTSGVAAAVLASGFGQISIRSLADPLGTTVARETVTHAPNGANPTSAPASPARPLVTDLIPRELPGLHNVVAFSEHVYSGGMPDGARGAFESLRALGVRTIVSVDGARPDVEGARASGIRYVHLPIGYSGFEDTRKLELARALRDLAAPIYIHCHHGKHRSAGAAGAALVTLGHLTPEQAIARMGVSGTSPHYKGLFAVVRESHPLPATKIDEASNEFPEIAVTRGMVQAMVEIEHAFDHLKQVQQAGWSVPSDHPDLVPIAEAGRLTDALRALLDDPETKAKPPAFLTLLVRSVEEAAALEDAIEAAPIGRVDAAQSVVLREHLGIVARSCKECHDAYRD
ncbi:MAG: hypothetical protein SFZ23_06500 [Planctomycetota bacterium]|nr:hypothetical protein [Planctomycetota bacterium]